MRDPDSTSRDLTAAERLELAAPLRLAVADVVDLLDGTNRKQWVVNQWRKRPNDPFPEPVSGGRSPRFDAAEVLRWLWDEEVLADDRPAPEWFWQQAVKVLPPAVETSERAHLRGYLAALVAVAADRARTGGGPLGPAKDDLVAAAWAIERGQPHLHGLLAPALDRVTPDPDVVALLCRTLAMALTPSPDRPMATPAAQLLDRALADLADLSPETAVSHWLLVELVSTVSAAWSADAVLDPACGEALVLSEMATARGGRLRVAAMEIDVEAANIARIRFALRGCSLDVRVVDPLGSDGMPVTGRAEASAARANPGHGSFDIVVLDPPSGKQVPGLSQWLDLVDGALATGGRAAVAVPASSLRANASGAGALHRRQVAAVVLVPARARHAVRDAQAVAIIEADGGCEQVLVVDLRHVTHRNEDNPIGAVADLVNQWISGQRVAGDAQRAFTDRTGVRAWVRTAAEVLADGVLPAPAAVSDVVLDQVIDLRAALEADADVPGADKLRRALEVFAKKHRRHRVGDD